MSDPYRSEPPYGTWYEKPRRWFLHLWAVRSGKKTLRTFKSVRGAMRFLKEERQHGTARDPFIFSRPTGLCLRPPPDILDEALAGICPICKAKAEERCDAGLHS